MPIDSDPDLQVGDILTLERADGRSVWRQRLGVIARSNTTYTLQAVDV